MASARQACADETACRGNRVLLFVPRGFGTDVDADYRTDLARIARNRRHIRRARHGSVSRRAVNLDRGKIRGTDENHRIVPEDGRHTIRIQTEVFFPDLLGVCGFADDVCLLLFVHALDAVMRGDGIFRHTILFSGG